MRILASVFNFYQCAQKDGIRLFLGIQVLVHSSSRAFVVYGPKVHALWFLCGREWPAVKQFAPHEFTDLVQQLALHGFFAEGGLGHQSLTRWGQTHVFLRGHRPASLRILNLWFGQDFLIGIGIGFAY